MAEKAPEHFQPETLRILEHERGHPRVAASQAWFADLNPEVAEHVREVLAANFDDPDFRNFIHHIFLLSENNPAKAAAILARTWEKYFSTTLKPEELEGIVLEQPNLIADDLTAIRSGREVTRANAALSTIKRGTQKYVQARQTLGMTEDFDEDITGVIQNPNIVIDDPNFDIDRFLEALQQIRNYVNKALRAPQPDPPEVVEKDVNEMLSRSAQRPETTSVLQEKIAAYETAAAKFGISMPRVDLQTAVNDPRFDAAGLEAAINAVFERVKEVRYATGIRPASEVIAEIRALRTQALKRAELSRNIQQKVLKYIEALRRLGIEVPAAFSTMYENPDEFVHSDMFTMEGFHAELSENYERIEETRAQIAVPEPETIAQAITALQTQVTGVEGNLRRKLTPYAQAAKKLNFDDGTGFAAALHAIQDAPWAIARNPGFNADRFVAGLQALYDELQKTKKLSKDAVRERPCPAAQVTALTMREGLREDRAPDAQAEKDAIAACMRLLVIMESGDIVGLHGRRDTFIASLTGRNNADVIIHDYPVFEELDKKSDAHKIKAKLASVSVQNLIEAALLLEERAEELNYDEREAMQKFVRKIEDVIAERMTEEAIQSGGVYHESVRFKAGQYRDVRRDAFDHEGKITKQIKDRLKTLKAAEEEKPEPETADSVIGWVRKALKFIGVNTILGKVFKGGGVASVVKGAAEATVKKH